MTGLPLKDQLAEQHRPSRQSLSSELLFNYGNKLDFRSFSWELMTRSHNADGMLFASLFLSETERNQIFLAYLKQQGYAGGNPLYTAIAIMTGSVDELFEEQYLTKHLLPNWRIHCAIVLKTLTQGQSADKLSKAREFISRLADSLLTDCNDVVAYLSLSLLADSFSFSLLQQKCRTNLVNIDL